MGKKRGKAKSPGCWYNSGTEAGNMWLPVVFTSFPLSNAPPQKNSMKVFPGATKIDVCSSSQAPSSGTAPLLRVGSSSSLWTHFLHGTHHPCSSFMCKMGQELRPGSYNCRRGFLQRCAERLFPVQAKGWSCVCLPATSYSKQSQHFGGLGGTRAVTWDQTESRQQVT